MILQVSLIDLESAVNMKFFNKKRMVESYCNQVIELLCYPPIRTT